MKEYIRTTHNFNNEKREWVGRDEIGQDKHGIWNHESFSNYTDAMHTLKSETGHLYSMGVHALERDYWMNIDNIVDITIKMYLGGAVDWSIQSKFETFIKENKNYKEIIKSDILKELNYLIEINQVKVRDK